MKVTSSKVAATAKANNLPYAFTRSALEARDDAVVPYVRQTPRRPDNDE